MAFPLPLARSLAWALLIGGWLALGAAGRWALPLWLGGMAALVLWLLVVGAALQLGRTLPLSGRQLRLIVSVSGGLTGVSLLWLAHSGSGLALLSATVGWGVLIVGASRGVRLLRGEMAAKAAQGSHASPVFPAVTGAALAWACVGDAAGRPAFALMLGVTGAAMLMAVLIPRRRAAANGCRAGLFDCALPSGAAAAWRSPAGWAAGSARWSMLPMMASLAAMTDWCSAAMGQTPAQVSAAHLAAMLLPAALLQLSGAAPALHARCQHPAWAALPMAAGLACLALRPDLQGLMAASLCHALAWGWVWSAQLQGGPKTPTGPDAPVVQRPAAPPRWRDSLVPALIVGLLGLALAAAGPQALVAVHAGLGWIALVGLLGLLFAPSSIARVTQRAQAWQHGLARRFH